jgi:hemerythrin
MTGPCGSNRREAIVGNFFEWDSGKYGLNVREMDAEHQKLIALMNKLHLLHEKGAATPELGKALGELVAYTVQHFADEEAFMARIGYPELRVHTGVHKSLLARVTEYAEEFKKSGKLTDAFFMFLKTWLKAHICGVDAKYGQHANHTHAA